MILIDIESVIYFYMFICVALLVFNIGYIFRAKGKSRTQEKRVRYWAEEIAKAVSFLEKEGTIPREHSTVMQKKLGNINHLMAYNEALLSLSENGVSRQYLEGLHDPFQVVAAGYAAKSPMERAFFAYVMSLHHPSKGREHDQLVEILLDFMHNATVYCRENVLQAIYVMGSPAAIESAFRLMSDEGLYHNSRLLSDGLMKFSGNKEELAWRLWNQHTQWSECIQIAIVQFATQLSDAFQQTFLAALLDHTTYAEVRFAIVRYFQRHVYEDALPFLLSTAKDADRSGDGLAIPVCAALASYPGETTVAALMQAVHSRNWYVRKNAAMSLVELHADADCLKELRKNSDRYAEEMLMYARELKMQKGGKRI